VWCLTEEPIWRKYSSDRCLSIVLGHGVGLSSWVFEAQHKRFTVGWNVYALYYGYTWTVATTVYHKQESITVCRRGRFWRRTRWCRYDGTTRRERPLPSTVRITYSETRSPVPLPRFRVWWESCDDQVILFVTCSGGWKVRRRVLLLSRATYNPYSLLEYNTYTKIIELKKINNIFLKTIIVLHAIVIIHAKLNCFHNC